MVKMKKENLENIVAFCVLMENGEGILDKSPLYIKEKFYMCIELGGKPFDFSNQNKYDEYFKIWEKDKNEMDN